MGFADAGVTVEDSVAMTRSATGAELRDAYARDIEVLTVGLVRMRGTSLWVGPVELLRFGDPEVSTNRVEWAIEGGLLARAPGGSFRIESTGGKVVSKVHGYRPTLPMAVYRLTQLPIHHLIARLQLLRVRGRRPAPGVPAVPAKRLAAAAIDLGFCASLAALSGKRRRLPALVGIAVGYHLACWSLGGRTLGGLVMGQRVVAVDGSRLSLGQALVRLGALPAAALRLRAEHDQAAGTDVVET